ncbi:putative lectin [Phytophthora cinnamomi]|uniref:putative lectin n=1 Tax=Phytophthora cinnamomi TaxID=4785 RepID=UPI00355A3DDB|nr:putative lectin [Phytophthora cinnamomi]
MIPPAICTGSARFPAPRVILLGHFQRFLAALRRSTAGEVRENAPPLRDAAVRRGTGRRVGRPLPGLTFKQPYEVVDSDGRRQIADGVLYGGNTEVKKNFIRLTPDRQSKRGHIWSKGSMDRDELATVITYRIHGQGKKWFGDGIGLWFTHEPQWKNGDNHGFTDKYVGFGIVLDTFHNVEHRGGHKDVTIQVNDGTKRLDDLNDESKIGCDAAFRYHANSANFDPVYSSSRIRVKVKGTALEVDVDPNNAGTWTECYRGNLPFQSDWLRRATFGISASTGALADNHDILRVQSFDQINDAGLGTVDAETWSHNYSKDFVSLMESDVCDQSCKVTILEKYVTNFQVETEHWFEMLREQTDNTINKLKEKERQNQRKIQALTDRMTTMMDKSIGLKAAEMRSKVNDKIATEVEGELTVARSSWRLPFFIMLVLIAGGVGVAYQKYRKLVKSHLY